MYTNPSSHFPYFYGSAYLGNGLYTYNRGSQPFTAGDYANWYFNAPGNSRIVRADFGYVKHEPQTTGTWPAPYNDDRIYEGVWSYTYNRYETGTWCEPAESGGACGRSPFTTYGALNYNTKSHTNFEGTPGNAAIFGTSVYYSGNHTDFTSFLGSSTIFIADDGAPTLTDDNGLSDSSWTRFRVLPGPRDGLRPGPALAGAGLARRAELDRQLHLHRQLHGRPQVALPAVGVRLQ